MQIEGMVLISAIVEICTKCLRFQGVKTCLCLEMWVEEGLGQALRRQLGQSPVLP